jgi:hypothetical protein
MRIALAPRYRFWMFAFLPSTLGLGSAILWLRSLKWPLALDEQGLTLRNHRQVDWRSITKIGVSRSYCDGHVSEMRIHYGDGVSTIPAHALQDGQLVARAILTMFERARNHCQARTVVDGQRIIPEGRRSFVDGRSIVTKRTHESGKLTNARAIQPLRSSRTTEVRSSGHDRHH